MSSQNYFDEHGFYKDLEPLEPRMYKTDTTAEDYKVITAEPEFLDDLYARYLEDRDAHAEAAKEHILSASQALRLALIALDQTDQFESNTLDEIYDAIRTNKEMLDKFLS